MHIVFQNYFTKFLPWSSIEECLNGVISSALKRKIKCKTKIEANDFWSVNIIDGRLSLDEINLLLDVFHASSECRRESLPEESNSSACIGMLLSELMLKRHFSIEWNRYFFDDDGIWIIEEVDYEKRN